MATPHILFQNAVVFDSETTSLTTKHGQGLVEATIHTLDTNETYEYIVKPNLIKVSINNAIDQISSAGTPVDVLSQYHPAIWLQVYEEQLRSKGMLPPGDVTPAQVLETLKAVDEFQYEQVKKIPHLRGRKPTTSELAVRAQLFEEFGLPALVTKEVTTEELFKAGGELETRLRGKSIWIYNANFEGRLVGAHIRALSERQRTAVWKSKDFDYIVELTGVKETRGEETWVQIAQEEGKLTYVPEKEISLGPVPKPPATELKQTLENYGKANDFYTTGPEIMKTRAEAQVSNDWSLVYKAMLNPSKPGETRILDIIDVVKSMHSLGEKLGYIKTGLSSRGLAADVVFRLLGSTEEEGGLARKLAKLRESHRSTEDAAITEKYILKRAVEFNDVMLAALEGTTEGKEYVEAAKKGEGPLAQIQAYFGRKVQFSESLETEAAINRIARAQRDIIEEGEAKQFVGYGRVFNVPQETPSGEYIEAPVRRRVYESFENIDDVVQFLKNSGEYTHVDFDVLGKTLAEELKGADPDKRVIAVNKWETAEKAKLDVLDVSKLMHIKGTKGTWGHLLDGFTASKMRFLGASAATLGAGYLMFGGLAAALTGERAHGEERKSVTGYNYDMWLKYQREFGGLDSEGENQRRRAKMTDFGSPYQGPVGSQLVFHTQELLHEREKWIDKQYGIMHFDPQVGLFGLAGPFKDAMPRGYKLIGEGVGVEPTGILRGDNLRKLNLEKYKLSVEDGDTITLRRRGLKGWLGLGSQYKIRLAGIDAPETGTADYTEDSYHKRQPYAMASKAMLEAMTKQGGDLELFYDPYQSTYGRSVGALYINGQNVNLEMVKRGGAAFLPYGKAEKDIIYRKVFERADQGAFAGRTGIWKHGFFQAHKYLSDAAGGERITFNTYTRRRKIVESQAQMDALALMEQAEDQGFISNQQIIESQLIGSFLMPGESDSVRPIGLSKAEHYHDLYLDQMKDDLRELMVTRGSKVQQNKFSRKGSYQNLDKSLVLDSMGSTNNIFLKRKLSYINSYSLRAEQRKAMQIYAQQTANQSMFASPIGHHRM